MGFDMGKSMVIECAKWLFPLGSCSDDENQSTVQHAFPKCKLTEVMQGGGGGISLFPLAWSA